MSSEDGDIMALLSEPVLREEQLEASESDDFLPAILEAIKANEKAVELSPAEAAWADSCFVKASDLSDDDWGAMKNALLDALEKPESPYDQGIQATSEGKHHPIHDENFSKHEDEDMEQRSNGDDDDDKHSTEACEIADVIRSSDEHGKQMDNYATKSENFDEFSPFEVLEETESRDSIFKVWDLDLSFPDDDGGEPELIKDLKKLLKYKGKDKESSEEAVYPHPPPPSDDAMKPLNQISMDELVAGLSDLSI